MPPKDVVITGVPTRQLTRITLGLEVVFRVTSIEAVIGNTALGEMVEAVELGAYLELQNPCSIRIERTVAESLLIIRDRVTSASARPVAQICLKVEEGGKSHLTRFQHVR